MLTKIIVQINMKFQKEDEVEREKQKHVGETRVVMFLLYRPFILYGTAARRLFKFFSYYCEFYLFFETN